MSKAVSIASILVIGTLSVFLAQPAKAEAITLAVVERATSDAVADIGPTGDSAGDILFFANEVFDQENVTKVGTDNGYCIRTSVGAAWECTWTNTFEGGQITVQGSFLDVGDSVFVITGGTGVYKGASGEMLLHARDAAASAYDFLFAIDR